MSLSGLPGHAPIAGLQNAIFICAMLANVDISCCCPSITSQCSTETAKCRIMQTVPHDSSGTLVFWRWKSCQWNSNGS